MDSISQCAIVLRVSRVLVFVLLACSVEGPKNGLRVFEVIIDDVHQKRSLHEIGD